ncbi:thioesterase II family protein [Streptomyces sp. NPDC050988]|uniref:thioesterase II family protein n=1 Tax=Streptomyces sp. NPDC050988 TaxID=3365637 RepID=UPI0037A38010
MTTTEYLARAPQPHPAVRLLCFPFAGGGASAYARWQRELDARGASVDVLPVRLPGREGRPGEPRFTELAALVEELDAELDEVLASPHLLYGHSMGALIAYALIRRRQQRGAPLPRAALLAAYRAPHLPPPRIDSDAGFGAGFSTGSGSGAGSGDGSEPGFGSEPIFDAEPGFGAATGADSDLVRALVALGGLPEALLGHPEWLRALLHVVRDDLALCASAGPSGEPVRVPLHLFAGADDSLVRVPEVTAWRRYAARGCEVRVLPGGHFFLRTHEGRLLDEVAPLVRRYGERRPVHAAAS